MHASADRVLDRDSCASARGGAQHAMPGHVTVRPGLFERCHRVADLPRSACASGQRGNGTVGGHAPLRDQANDAVEDVPAGRELVARCGDELAADALRTGIARFAHMRAEACHCAMIPQDRTPLSVRTALSPSCGSVTDPPVSPRRSRIEAVAGETRELRRRAGLQRRLRTTQDSGLGTRQSTAFDVTPLRTASPIALRRPRDRRLAGPTRLHLEVAPARTRRR